MTHVPPCEEPHVGTGFLGTIWPLGQLLNTALELYLTVVCLEASFRQKAMFPESCPRGCVILPKSPENKACSS